MRRTTTARLAGVLAVGSLAATAPSALATETLVGASNENAAPEVSLFESHKPGDTKRLQVIGLAQGERIAGLDVRPSTGTLYAQGVRDGSSQNYVVQLSTDEKAAGFDGQAIFSPIGARYGTNGTAFGYDFNPTVDRLRVISDHEQNLRIAPNTGAAITDGTLRYAPTDANAGKNPDAVAAAYIPAPFGGTTTLYDIDAAQDTLAVQMPANEGILLTRGSLGVDVYSNVGFDIIRNRGEYGGGNWYSGGSRTGDLRAYASMQPEGTGSSRLYKIDLASGRASEIGKIDGDKSVEALAILGHRSPEAYTARASRRK